MSASAECDNNCDMVHCRHGNGRYEYSALEDDANHPERLEMESKAQRSASRDKANFKCQQYLYNSNRYVYVEQLSDIGMPSDLFTA
jgi:hypothetical protein